MNAVSAPHDTLNSRPSTASGAPVRVVIASVRPVSPDWSSAAAGSANTRSSPPAAASAPRSSYPVQSSSTRLA